LFSDDAVRAIHAHARGRPAINKLAITALLAAFSAGKTIADKASARTAITEDTTTD
jgi:type II secretory pathway predicted ATPase ExeA